MSMTMPPRACERPNTEWLCPCGAIVRPRRAAHRIVARHVLVGRRQEDGGGLYGARGARSHPPPRGIWDSIALPTVFAAPARFDFRTGLPDASLFPHRTWRRLVACSLRSPDDVTGIYEHAAGHAELRKAIVRHIGSSRGVEAAADDVTITNGTQQALDILARVLAAPGDRIAVEEPGTYRRGDCSSR